MELEKLIALGQQLGYEDDSLRKFVADEQTKLEKKAELALQQEERAREREERAREREDRILAHEQREKEAQREHEIKMAEANREMLEIKVQNLNEADKGANSGLIKSPSIKIPAYEDGRDDLDAYIRRFERFAISQGWKRESWAVSLSALLKGKALEVYSRLSPEESVDYDKLKNALLKRFQLTEDGYRAKFRTSHPQKGETPCQFAARLSSYFHRWVELSGIELEYEKLVDLLLREQFTQSCSKELSAYLKEKRYTSVDVMADAAERYTEAHGLSSFTPSGQRGNGYRPTKVSDIKSSENKQNGSTATKKYNQSSGGRRCYICGSPSHLANDCGKKNKPIDSSSKALGHALKIPSKTTHKKKSKSVWNGEPAVDDISDSEVGCQVNEVRKCCGDKDMTVQASQDTGPVKNLAGELHECCKADGNSVRLQCGHRINFLNMACPDKSTRNSQMPTCEGLLDGKRVVVLRDTGCSSAVVRSSLVPKDQFLGENQTCVLIDGTVRKFPLATVNIDTPYYAGKLRVLCMANPVYDLIIGNVKGALEPNEPDTEWTNRVQNETHSDEDQYSNHAVKECAVETRQMKKQQKKSIRPLQVPSQIAEVSSDEFLELQRADENLKHLWEKANSVHNEEQNKDKYRFIIRNKFLLRRSNTHQTHGSSDQLVVPTGCRQAVIRLAHEGLMAGHQGITRTYERVRSKFYWPGFHEDVVRFCRSCDICQRTLPKGKVTQVPLGRMPLIDTPFKRIAMDLVGPIYPPSDRGHRYIVTIVDYATRYPEAAALKNIDTESVAEAVISVYTRVGVPSEVLTDMGVQFTSDLMREISRLLSIKQLTCTPYHPITNGLTEKFNGTLKLMLKRMCAERPRDWDRYLDALLFCYREAPQESLGFSPFELLYGRTVRGPMTILSELWTREPEEQEVKSTYQYVIDLKNRLYETCEMAQKMLAKSAGRYKIYYDQKR